MPVLEKGYYMGHPTMSRVFKAGWRCFCSRCRTAIEKGQPCRVVYVNRKLRMCVHEQCADTKEQNGHIAQQAKP